MTGNLRVPDQMHSDGVTGESIGTNMRGMHVVSMNGGTISTDNSTTTLLTSGQTYQGTWENISNYASISIIANADVAGTLYALFSTDGVNTDRTVQLSSTNSTDLGIHSLTTVAKYFAAKVVNGGTGQASFRLQTILNKGARIAFPTSRMAQSLNDYSDVLNTRSVLVGKTEGGNYYQNISSNDEGHLEVSVQGPVSAFGELSTIQPHPLAQVDFIYGINSYTTVQATTGSGQVTNGNQLLDVKTTAATSSSAQLSSIRYLKYRAGQGGKIMLTALFTAGATGSKQYAGAFTTSLNNGFGFGYNGTVFGIWHMNGGTPTHIPQSTWNGDLCNGAGGANNKSGINLVPTNGNVYKIIYQYLGFGNIKFYIENSINGQWSLVHEIRYPNTYTATSLTQPSLNLLWRAENTTNATNISVKAGSGALFIEGERRLLGPSHGLDHNKSLTATTHTNIITIKNATTYNGVNNRAHLRLRHVTFAANTGGTGSGIVTLKVVRNATLGGTPSYTTINGTTADGGVTITSGNSIASYDIAGTTVTGGAVIYNAIIGIGNNDSENLVDLDLFGYPGDTITFSLTSTQNATGGIGVTWTEDL